jgi:ribonuclease BN (tRNA processing enzyme)
VVTEPRHASLASPSATSDPWELEWREGSDRLIGRSTAALATAWAVPRWGVAVDMGRCSPVLAAQGTVLLTHCHADHSAGLIAWLSARVLRIGDTAPRIVVPAERRDTLLSALTAWPDLSSVRRRVDLEAVVIPAEAGNTVALTGDGAATAFPIRHSVPSLGWKVGPKTDGAEPWAVLAGDSTVEPFVADPDLLTGHLAIVDCSFVDPGRRVAARLAGHGHLADWLDLAPRLRCRHLILAHLPPEVDAPRMEELLAEAAVPTSVTLVGWVGGRAAPSGDQR